jgi:hypothetical protein
MQVQDYHRSGPRGARLVGTGHEKRFSAAQILVEYFIDGRDKTSEASVQSQ